MTDPAAPTGPSADGADMASTDMSPDPSSREPDTQPSSGGGGSGLPMEPDAQAIRRLEDQLEQERERHLRLAAEYDNYRKRVARERAELADRAQAALRPAAARCARRSGSPGRRRRVGVRRAVREAVGLVDRKLRKELRPPGWSGSIRSAQPFDPSQHEAVVHAAAAGARAGPQGERHVPGRAIASRARWSVRRGCRCTPTRDRR